MIWKQHIRVWGSILACVLVVHLIVSYLYAGSRRVGEIGGSMNIGIVSETPDGILHPLQYGSDPYQDMILRFMFRSLLAPRIDGRGYENDLAHCTLEPITEIRCQLDPKATWSDGSPITMLDVVRTLRSIGTHSANASLAQLVPSLEISGSGQALTIRSQVEDPLLLELLSYPIARSDMIDQIETNRLTPENYIHSAAYTFISNEEDTVYGGKKITLTRRSSIAQGTYIDRYVFRFFTSPEQLEKNKDLLSLILPYNGVESFSQTVPRFSTLETYRYSYIGLFFHTDRLSTDLRKLLSTSLGTALSRTLDTRLRPIPNIFFGSTAQYQTKPETTIEQILRNKGYKKTDELLREVHQIPTTITGTFTIPSTDFFTAPENVAIQFLPYTDEGVLLEWALPSWVEKVLINTNALQEHTPQDTGFSYRIAPDRGNFSPGKNIYRLDIIHEDPKKNATEVLTIYAFRSEEERIQLEQEARAEFSSSLNTPEQIAQREKAKEEKRQKIDALDSRFFYSPTLLPYTLKLVALTEPPDQVDIAEQIKKTMIDMGIVTSIELIPQKNLTQMIASGQKNYDLLLVGFDTKKRSQLGQFFESKRAATDINFAKIQDSALDTLWGKYRLASTPEAIDTLEREILSRLIRFAPMIPVTARSSLFLIDRNFYNTTFPTVLGDIRIIHRILAPAYIKEIFIMNIENKNFSGFWSWVGGEDITSVEP